MEFNKNPTPTAVVRERIAQEINMTERSVQIWFQNRYVVIHIHFDRVTPAVLTSFKDEPRSKILPRRVSRTVKTAMTFLNRCVAILLFKLWNLANLLGTIYLPVEDLATTVVIFPTPRPAPVKSVSDYASFK